jgi:formylglycine-generating enzyme required for sulfatase activity
MDEISVFYSENTQGGSKFTSQNTEQTAIAEFKGRLEGVIAGGEDFTNGKYLYAVYPYSIKTGFNNGVTTISLPNYQTAVEGTFANGLFPTIARAQGVNLAFYNICGGVKFTVSRNDIASVIFKGNNGERLGGAANVVFDEYEKPSVWDEEVDSKTEITVYAPTGGTFEAGKEYYIVAYPAKLSSGFTMTFRTTEMKEGAYVSNSAIEIKRSVFGVLSEADKSVTSWTDITSGGGGYNSGIYVGIMGFNQQLYSYPISELTDTGKSGFDTFIDDLNMKNGALLYYSVDQAINTLQSVPLPADLSTVAIVTFTDGLDQGSMMMNTPDTYSDDTQYLDAINQRIKNETVRNQPITAYSIGIRGQDVTDVTKFQNNLAKLASSADNATEVSSMAEVNTKFKEIAKQLSQSSYIQTINLKIPGVSNGTLIRFTFDNVTSAEKSALYIEGTFNLTERSLEDVKYVGLTSSSGTTVKGSVNGIFVNLTFEDVHTDNNQMIDKQYTNEWSYIASNNTWQINSEFDKTENTDIITKRSSAVIMLVLDCSSSLGEEFPKGQTNAKDFIKTLHEASTGEDIPGEDPGNSGEEPEENKPFEPEMVSVQGGTFMMGSPTSESGRSSNEGPQHQVTVSSFRIGKYEVTQGQWEEVMGRNPSGFNKGSNYPVENVSHNDIETYLQKLNAATGKQYRLPTEAEWEYAARGGNQGNGYLYSGSNILGNVAWHGSNSGNSTHPVGQKSPNELGIYDMCGNVFEWCSDWYGIYPSSPQTNPTGASPDAYRMLRGGSWFDDPVNCRVAYRRNATPDYHDIDMGFRVVLP